jgi:NEDD8-activating enzyme E1 regulatory subunit
MKAQSEVYVRLQNIYKTKARQDVAEVKQIVQSHPHGKKVEDEEIETYCKNAAFIKLIRSTIDNPTDLEALVGSYLSTSLKAVANMSKMQS